MLLKRILFTTAICISVGCLFSQEKLLSSTESYLDFLALEGYVERPYLSYRTLSDSKWKTSYSGLWKQNTELANSQKPAVFRIYGPELYTSYNSAAPYGQNDGLLWQGKGLNSYLSAGLRFENKGFEITFKPEIVFSENKAFPFVTPAYSGGAYVGKADTYGYYGVSSIDAPQRFGNKTFVNYGWGDSEIRYSIKSFTLGFGSQYLWLGPAKINPILHSNNAASYPKIDLGLRRTKIHLWKWYAGDIEARLWAGKLRESNYFDSNDANNNILLTGLTLGYAPSFVKGLNLTVNRIFLSPWEPASLNSIADLLYIPSKKVSGARDIWDQRVSFSFDYSLPLVGFETYLEIGVNDYCPIFDGYIRYPFHSMVYTAGMRKSVSIDAFSIPLRGEFLLEISNLEMSQDFQSQWPSTFYAHHQITQGYTNRGQWLGAGNGTGGNSQYIGFKIYHQKGNVATFIHRKNPDNDYIYQYTVGTANSGNGTDYISDFKAVLSTGINSLYFINSNIQLSGGINYIIEHNPLYNSISWGETSKLHGFRLEAGIAYSFQ